MISSCAAGNAKSKIAVSIDVGVTSNTLTKVVSHLPTRRRWPGRGRLRRPGRRLAREFHVWSRLALRITSRPSSHIVVTLFSRS